MNPIPVLPKHSIRSFHAIKRYLGSTRAHDNNVTTSSSGQNLKSVRDIPTSKSILPPVIQLLLDGGPNYLHKHCDRLHQELGPIFRHKLGPHELIFLADTELIRTVIANEGPYPHHLIPEAWTYFNKIKNVERGMFFRNGQPWARLRTNFNKVMLGDPRKMNGFTGSLLKINEDLFKYWISRSESSDIRINNVKAEFNKWSIESTGYILFGNRIGCIPEPDRMSKYQDNRPDQLVENVANMFAETSKLQFTPLQLVHKLQLRTWIRFEEASSNMIELATDLTKEQISRLRESRTNHGLVEGLLDTLSDDEITKSVVDLIIAAADTTSNSLQWMLYLVAKHKEVQAKLLNEVTEVFSNLKESDNFLERANYLRAFLKESSRLYPTAPFIARTIDKEIVLDSYLIPAGNTFVFSCYTTSRMERYFDEPQSFRPERWMRTSRPAQGARHACASLPFGLGVRMCIGKRAAELEMGLLIASMVKRFELSLLSEREAEIRLNMITGPLNPIRLKLKPR